MRTDRSSSGERFATRSSTPHNHLVPEVLDLQVVVDAQARQWLDSHPRAGGLVVDYDVHRCCGGGKICEVRIRPLSTEHQSNEYARGATADGMTVWIDPRAAARLPRRFGLTVRGVGRWKRLDLDLEPDQWGDLLWA